MFIIIEGIHDTGKTSLIDSLVENTTTLLQFQSKRLFPELAGVQNTSISDFATGTNCAITWFAKYFSGTNPHILFDRLHFSEYAYSKLFRDVDETIALNRFRIIDDKLSQFNVKLVYLECDYEILCNRRKDKNNMYTESHFKKLSEHFNKLINITKMNKLIVNTGECNKEQTYLKVKNFIQEE